jgi:hypothetical protein
MSYGHADTINHSRPTTAPAHRPPLRTALAFIRLAERRGHVPRDDRLDMQPCEEAS